MIGRTNAAPKCAVSTAPALALPAKICFKLLFSDTRVAPDAELLAFNVLAREIAAETALL